MNLADAVFETFMDNEVRRICNGCLHPRASHEYRIKAYGPCVVEDCDCRGYEFRERR